MVHLAIAMDVPSSICLKLNITSNR